MWDHVSFNELVENNFWKPAAMLIGIGSGALLVGWLGWNSTRKRNRCNLGLVSCSGRRSAFLSTTNTNLAAQFCTLLLLSSFVQVYVAYWAHDLRGQLLKTRSENVELRLDTTFMEFFVHHKEQSSHIWNRVQEEYQCCGVDGPSNYRQGNAVPWSCFARDVGETEAEFSAKAFIPNAKIKINHVGCLEVLSTLLRRHLLYGALGALASAGLQVGEPFLNGNFYRSNPNRFVPVTFAAIRQFYHTAADHAARPQAAAAQRPVQGGHDAPQA